MDCRTLMVLFAVGVLALLPGCIERRFRIESNPPGAYVFVKDQPYGPTPVDVPFLFYGTYDIKLVKEGFETQNIREHIQAPWFEYPPIDFFSENLYPRQITDIRPLYYEMEPFRKPNLELLRAEGEELRERAKTLPPPRFPPEKKERPEGKLPAPKEGTQPPTKDQALPPPRPVSPYPVVQPSELPK